MDCGHLARLEAYSRKRSFPVVVGLAIGLAACGERSRLLFDPDTDGVGPDTTIDLPEAADAELIAGPDFDVVGRSTDTDGVDTVYFQLINGNQQFQPFVPSEFSDTVRFSIPISTTGRAGDTVHVLIFATDLLGTRGDTAIRRLLIR